MTASFRFAQYEIHLASRRLLRAGEDVQIRPRIWELLVYLARTSYRPVSHEELRREVWRAQALSESSIPTAIGELRNTLGSDACFVETVPRLGYQLICPVQAYFPAPVSSEPFVGRDPEFRALTSALTRAAASDAQLVLICGDPGIGKTALVEHFARHASASGFAVLVGRCREDIGAPPFWPWNQLLRVWRGDDSFDLAGSAIDDLRQPAIADSTNPNAARFQIYESLSTSLHEVTSTTPLLILLEDIHRADLPSLLALHFVLDDLSNSRLLVLATYRDAGISYDRPRADAIGALSQCAATRSLNLSGLLLEAVSDLVSVAYPSGTAPDRFVQDLFVRTRGNPLFVRKLLDLLPSSGWDWDRPLPVPGSLRDAINAQLRRIPPDCLHLLQASAVLGPEIQVSVLAKMCSSTSEACLKGLGEAFEARLISCPVPNLLRFAHGLLWEVTYEGIPPHERCTLHLRAGRALEETRSPISGGMAAELAHHFAAGLDSERAFHYALAAAEWCGSQTAYVEAALHLRSALSTNVATSGARVALQIQLGEHELRAGNRAAGRAALIQAAHEARELGDAEQTARAALALAPNVLSIEAGVVDRELIDLLEDALSTLPAESSSLRTRVLSRLSIALVWTGETDRRARLSDEAIKGSGRLDDAVTRSEALVARHSLLCTPERRRERTGLISELAAITQSANLSESRLMASLLRITFLLEIGSILELDAEVDRFRALAVKLKQPHFLWYLDLFAAMRSLLEGRFEDAGRNIKRLYATGQQVQDANLWNCFGCHSAVQLWEFDQIDRALAIVSDFVMRFPRFDTWRAGKIFLETEMGRLDEARAEYDLLTADGFKRLIPNENWRMTLTFLARCATRFRDRAGAEILYDLLLPGSGTMVSIGYAVVCWAPQDRELGVLASFLGRSVAARKHFEQAMSTCRSLNAMPLLAQTEVDFAEALERTGAQDDTKLARTLREHAHKTAIQLGMERLERVATV